MKNEFILAFNEICESRGLPKEEVFEALKSALVQAYRRDTPLSTNQLVTAEIDPRTGAPTIYTEKEVVEDIFDDRTEVMIQVAQSQGYPDAEMGDLVMIDSTTESFGRIAAQTAKQVLLQRVREAERDQLFEDFSAREGELINGTVQSISGLNVTIGLGRTEAIMPKNQQVGGERYRAHDKIRVFVLEVRKTPRGPQIIVSRNHRNLLRRLLELEVPEIYNGQVDIKSIAREAGQRSKVAVQALQAGVDPVGACVGMRGVRIQSIVRELNDEKIDVIEWDPDQRLFIAKALSPARVSHVFLEENPVDGKTAIVVVPDDQLSLAIGREGQNARLAAKLTGWRIDIKSLTEAAGESLDNLDHPAVDPTLVADEVFLNQVRLVLDKKEAGRPVTAEDYMTLDKLVAGVEGRIVNARSREYDVVRRERMEIRKSIPELAWDDPLNVLDLPGRIHNLLLDVSVNTAGDLLFVLAMGDDYFLNFRGLGDVALATVKENVVIYRATRLTPEAIAAAAAAKAAAVEDEELDAGVGIEDESELVDAGVEAEEPDIVADVEDGVDAAEEVAAEELEEARDDKESVDEEPAPVEEAEAVLPIDDLSAPIFKASEEKPEKEKPQVVVVRPSESEKTEEDAKPKKRRDRALVYDENLDQVVVKRRRGGNEDWEEDLDLDEI